jgi:hypothetical protein
VCCSSVDLDLLLLESFGTMQKFRQLLLHILRCWQDGNGGGVAIGSYAVNAGDGLLFNAQPLLMNW